MQRVTVAPPPTFTAPAPPPRAATLPATPVRPQDVLQRLAEASQVSPPGAALPLPPPPRANVQRETQEATGRISRVETPAATPDGTTAEPIDIDRIADRVWKKIKRDLRVERERERGMP